MPTIEWLKQEFDYGYDSGNIRGLIPNKIRRNEEKKIGGSYRKVFRFAIRPYLNPNSNVLELGPGNGAWSRVILAQIPNGHLATVDFQDVTRWLQPEQYDGRLACHQVDDNSFDCIADDSVDFFWSMGVLCHNNKNQISEILSNSLAKMKHGGIACHQYSDWGKLERYGWERGGVPVDFQNQDDDEIWWPRNSEREMADIAIATGWKVECSDLKLINRDGIILLRKP